MKGVAIGLALWTSLLVAGSAWAGSPPKIPETLIITNVNVVDTRFGQLLPNITVIVKDGVIEGLTKVAVINTGAHTRVVNGNGKYLIPGLWDMSAHISGQAAAGWSRKSLFSLYLANGVTGIRNMDAANVDATAPAAELQPEIEPPEPVWAEVQQPLSLASPLGPQRTIQDLNEILLACSGQEHDLRDGGLEAITNSDLATHAYIAGALWETFDSTKAHDVFRKIVEHDTWVVPALVAEEPPPAEASEEPAWGKYAPARYRSAPRHLSTSTLLEQMAESQRDLRLVSDMKRSGVQFLTGTSAPSPQLFPGFSLHRELDLLVQGGFTPMEALQAATFNPAMYMAKLESYGVIEAGHIADMVLLDDNPLENIANVHKISGVILRGTFYPRNDLDAMLLLVEQESAQQVDTAKAADPKKDEPTQPAAAEIRRR